MRIVIFNWRCFRHPQAGGSELYLYELAKRWTAQGHKVVWITSRPVGTVREEERDGIRFLRAGGTFSIYLLSAVNYLRIGCQDVIIDVQNGIPFFTPFYTKVPVILLIYHVHTDVWKRESSWLTARIGSWIERKLMPMVYRRRSLVTISKSSAVMIDRLFGAHRTISIVYCGFSEHLVPGQKAEHPEIVYLGRLRRYKSVDVLLRAFQMLSDLSPVLHVAGQGEDETRLKALASELNLRNVFFHGYTDEADKVNLLQRAWVVANPSSMEGWGITNIEANACATPVVGADVPGIRDSISVGQSGVLVPYGDADALATALRSLIENHERRNEMGHTARIWAERFSWDVSATEFMNILKHEVSMHKGLNDE